MNVLSLAVTFFGIVAAAQFDAVTFSLQDSGIHDNLKSTSFKTPEAHHFNKDSPNFVESKIGNIWKKASDLKLNGTELTASWKEKIDPCQLRAVLYVCDDKLTYCLPRAQKFSCEGKRLVASKWDRNSESTTAPATAPHNKSFIDNDAQKAMGLAQESGKPVMIDFYGVWCPPCNQLDENVFNSEEFKKIQSQFVLLRLDADQPTSWRLKSKYKVGGYPTIVFATPGGDEISRVVGSRERAAFILEMKKALHQKNQPFDKKKLAADSKNDLSASYEVGLTYLERAENKEALTYLTKASSKWGPKDPKRNKLFSAQIGNCLDQTDKKACIGLIETALKEFPHTVEALDRYDRLAQLADEAGDKEKSKLVRENALKSAQWFLANTPVLKNEELTPGDLYGYMASQYEGLGKKEEARASYGKAYSELTKYIKKVGHDETTERGFNLDRLWYLWKSGETAKAEAAYEKLQEVYPTDFSFFFQHARLLNDSKRYDEALPKALKAMELSYGDNRLRVVSLVADLYSKKNEKGKALSLLNEAISRSQLPEDKTIRTHRYYDKLVQLKKKLEGV
jgi:tetratricopeptide (TPR) repeat protein